MPSWSPTPEQVHARIPTTMGGFDTTTDPTAAEVEELISQTVIDIVAEVGQFDAAEVINAEQVRGGDEPITLGDVARVVVATGAAWQIERAWHREQPVGGEADETRLYRQWLDGVERLRRLVATTRPQPRIHRVGTIGVRAPIETADR